MKMLQFHQAHQSSLEDNPVLVRADAIVAVEEIVFQGRRGDHRTRIHVKGVGRIEVVETFAQVRKAIQEALETATGAR